nr:hypothetical protein [uncultured Duganella sp.]
MSNVSIAAPLANSDEATYIVQGESCASAVEFICGDDTAPPVRHVVIEVKTESGKTVRVVIPNSQQDAVVYIDGDLV